MARIESNPNKGVEGVLHAEALIFTLAAIAFFFIASFAKRR